MSSEVAGAVLLLQALWIARKNPKEMVALLWTLLSFAKQLAVLTFSIVVCAFAVAQVAQYVPAEVIVPVARAVGAAERAMVPGGLSLLEPMLLSRPL